MKDYRVPEISLILPVYNSAQFLEECIESILNQTFDNFELIIVYDKSKDNSKDIIEHYRKIDDRIIFIENEKKLGVAVAINKGLEIARGKYIAKMDSDDVSLPNRLEREYLFLENNKDYFLIGSNGIRIDEKGNYLDKVIYEENPIDRLMKNDVAIIHSSIMFRNINIRYREKFLLSEDTDLYLRVLTMGLKLKNINEVLVKYRMTTSGICMTNYPRGKLFQDMARKFYIQRLHTGTDDYDSFDEKEIMSIPTEDSMVFYLKAMVGFSLKNGNIEDAKKYFEEYSKKISLIDRIKYKIVLTFPIIYPIRAKIKLFLKKNHRF